jgi:hypothetical protein
MEDYPSDYVAHNLPLILLSGLAGDDGQDQQQSTALQPENYPGLPQDAVQIFSDFPVLTDSTATAVLQALLAHDASHTTWSGKGDKGKSPTARFRVRRVGRVG